MLSFCLDPNSAISGPHPPLPSSVPQATLSITASQIPIPQDPQPQAPAPPFSWPQLPFLVSGPLEVMAHSPYLSVCIPLLSPAWSTVPHTHLHPGSRPRCSCSVDQSRGTLGRQRACHPQQTPLGSSMSPVPRPSRCPGNPPSVPHADAGLATDSPQVSGLSDAAPGPEAAASIKASFSSSC